MRVKTKTVEAIPTDKGWKCGVCKRGTIEPIPATRCKICKSVVTRILFGEIQVAKVFMEKHE